MLLQCSAIRIKKLRETLAGGGNPILYLPPPELKGMTLEFVPKSSTQELIDGSNRTRLLGYIPKYTVKWNPYLPEHYPQYAKGTSHGQMPLFEDLLKVLSAPSGSLAISPGLSTGWFIVDSISVKGVSKQGNYTLGVEITFTGRDILKTMELT